MSSWPQNSILTVTANKSDKIYLKEVFQDGNFIFRYPTIPQGYYTVESLRLAFQAALNGPTKIIPGEYIVTYNTLLARFEIANHATTFNCAFVLYTKESLEDPGKPATFPDIQSGNGAWRQLGLEGGLPIGATETAPVAVANAAPNLQQNTQLFIKSDLGIPATSVGPHGNQSICRRVIMDAPVFSLCIDKHATSWDSIGIAPTTLSTFSMALVGFDGEPVDLNGQPWSCSISIFRE